MLNIKEYLKQQLSSFLLRCYGIMRNDGLKYFRRITETLHIEHSKISDFSFIYNQILDGEKNGTFASKPHVEPKLLKAGRYHQFVSTIYINKMRNDPRPVTSSFLLSARLKKTLVGFVWGKELQGFPFSGWEINVLAVARENRRAKIASNLVDSAVEVIKANKIKHAFVRVKRAEYSKAMHKLLTAKGFEEVTKIKFEKGARMYVLSLS